MAGLMQLIAYCAPYNTSLLTPAILLNDKFQNACNSGNLNKVKDIALKNHKILDFQGAFVELCKYGHIQILKWLHYKYPYILNNIHMNEIAYERACDYGHKNIAKWLVKMTPNMNLADIDARSFGKACMNGHLKVARWLLHNRPNIIHTYHTKYLFGRACVLGKLRSAQYLLKLKETQNANIDVDLNYAFDISCKKGHVDVAHWLSQLNPFKYHLSICDGNIDYNIDSMCKETRLCVLYAIKCKGYDDHTILDLLWKCAEM